MAGDKRGGRGGPGSRRGGRGGGRGAGGQKSRRSTSQKRDQDHYARKAQAQGYQARSVFKLEEMDQRLGLLRAGQRVVDLGCAPGSWSRYARSRIGPSGHLVGVDLKEVDGFPGTFLCEDLEGLTAQRLGELLGGKAHVVLSDMAPNTSGAKDLDHLRQISLAEAALDRACALLRPGGSFVVKVFDGRDAPAFTAQMRSAFEVVKRQRPDATKRQSREFFLVGLRFRGTPSQPGEGAA